MAAEALVGVNLSPKFLEDTESLVGNQAGFGYMASAVMKTTPGIHQPYVGFIVMGAGLDDSEHLADLATFMDPDTIPVQPQLRQDVIADICMDRVNLRFLHGLHNETRGEDVLWWSLIPRPSRDDIVRINGFHGAVTSIFSLYRHLPNSRVPVLAVALFSRIFIDDYHLGLHRKNAERNLLQLSPFASHLSSVFDAAAYLVDMQGKMKPGAISQFSTNGTLM